MNYVTQLNAFFRVAGSLELSSSARMLYLSLLNKNNSLAWIKSFTCTASELESLSGLSTSGLQRARKQLVDKKVITYSKRGSNKAPRYSIPELLDNFLKVILNDTPNDSPNDTPNDSPNNTPVNTPNSTPNNSPNTLTKTKQNKLKQNNKDNVERAQHDIPFQSIIEYLNSKTSKHFKPVESNKKYIRARWNDGYRVDDFNKVVDNKCAEWLKDTDMNKYLRPETLFGTKFEGYLNSDPRPSRQESWSNKQQQGYEFDELPF